MEEELLPEYDNLSFSGFSILPEDDKGSNSVAMQSPRISLSSVDYNNNNDIGEEEYFEFSTTTDPPMMSSGGYSSPDVFCGKIDIREEVHQNHEYQKRDDDYLINNIVNISKEEAAAAEAVLAGKDVTIRSRSDSAIKRNSSYCYYNNTNNHNYGVHRKVNITSLTSMSSKSRRRMFLFGPVKFHPEMELSALKERQSRGRVPTTMFPAPLSVPAEVAMDGDKAAVVSTGAAAIGGGGNKKPTRGKIRSNWGFLVRSLKGRSPITTALAKSLGCIVTTPTSVVGMENKWIN